jgi:hypothetical protein
MKTTKTLLAAAILGVSAAAVAETTTAPVAPAYYVPYAVAPVTLNADQVRAAVEQYNRQAQAAFEQSYRAQVAALEQQRKVTEEFQRYHNDQIKAATSGEGSSYEEIRKAGDAMRADMDRLSQDLQARVLSGDRASLDAIFAARAQEMAARFAGVDKEMEAAKQAFDARFAEAQKAPLTPMVLPGHTL